MLLPIDPCCNREAMEWASITLSSAGSIDFQKDIESNTTGSDHRHQSLITPDATLNPFVISASTCFFVEVNQTYVLSSTSPPAFTQITPSSANSLNRLCVGYSTNAVPSTTIGGPSDDIDSDHSASEHDGAEFLAVYDAGGSSFTVEGTDYGFTPNGRDSILADIPAGSSAGDTCIIILMDQFKTILTPTGWTQDTRSWCASNDQKITSYRKILTAGDISTGTVEFKAGVDKVLEYLWDPANSHYSPDNTGKVDVTYNNTSYVDVANGYAAFVNKLAHVEMKDILNLNLWRQDWTYELLYRPDHATQANGAFALTDNIGSARFFRFSDVTAGDGINVKLTMVSHNFSFTSSGNYALDTFYHLVIEKIDQIIYFYIDGAFEDSQDISSDSDLPLSSEAHQVDLSKNDPFSLGPDLACDSIKVYSGAFYGKKTSNLY